MTAARFYSNTAQQTSLNAGINNSVSSIVVGATSGFPASTPFTLVLDPETASEEAVTVTAVAGTTLTVTRGVDGTVAVTHSAGAAVIHAHTARDFQESQDHIGSTADVHGIGGGNNVVGTGSTQVLSNKDLTAVSNTFPTTVVKTTVAQVLTNKDLTSLTNSFPQGYVPQPGDYKFTAASVSASPTVVQGGWLKADGGAVSRTTFAALFAVIGTQYGAGDGSTTFNLPDMRGRVPIGAGTFAALGANEGDTEANRGLAHKHSIPNEAAHSHTISSGGGHTHGLSTNTDASSGGTLRHVTAVNTQSDGAHDHSGSTGAAGLHNHGGQTGNGLGGAAGEHIAYGAGHFLIKT